MTNSEKIEVLSALRELYSQADLMLAQFPAETSAIRAAQLEYIKAAGRIAALLPA